jgi:hypothetical protein
VGNNGKITTSADGTTWTERSSGTTSDLHGVAWTGSYFITVGRDDFVYSSADAISWSSVDTGREDLSLNSIAVNAGTIIAAGDDGVILKSLNGGAVWTESNTDTRERLLAVAHGVEVWVAVGTRGTVLRSINDGNTWTSQPSGLPTQDLGCIAYGPEGFRIISSGGVILGSATGAGWTEVGRLAQAQGDVRINQLVWAAGQWVAVGAETDADADHAGVLFHSENSTNFQRIAINTTLPLKGFTMAAGTPCFVGERGFVGSVTRFVLWQVNSISQLESGPAVNLTAQLSNSTNEDLTVPISWSGTVRVGNSGDVRSVPASITIPANATTTSITLQLHDDVPPVIIPPPSLNNFATGQNLNVALSASNSPTQWIVTGLPPGLRVSSSGVISGRVLAPGTYKLRIVASNATGSSAPVEVTWQVLALDAGLLGGL